MAGQSNFARDVLVVLVIYEIDISSSPTYQSLENAIRSSNQQVELFIYDNSQIKQAPPHSAFWTITYEHHSDNRGVSGAYNRGFEMAKAKGKKWLWLLDQDDSLVTDTFSKYETAVNSFPNENIFIPKVVDQKSFLSPFHFSFGGGKRVKEVYPGTYALSAFYFINSGMLISVSTFESAGGYSNDFPLDFSDIDFILRLRKKTDRVVVLPLIVQHNLSSNVKKEIIEKLTRFRSYLQAASRFRIHYRNVSRFIVLRSLIRTIKLSIQYKTLEFFKVYRMIKF